MLFIPCFKRNFILSSFFHFALDNQQLFDQCIPLLSIQVMNCIMSGLHAARHSLAEFNIQVGLVLGVIVFF